MYSDIPKKIIEKLKLPSKDKILQKISLYHLKKNLQMKKQII